MSPPDQFAEPTDGHVGRRVARRVDDDERDGARVQASRGTRARGREKTSTTPTGRRRMTPSIQSGSGEWRLPLTVSTTLRPCALATDSTPSMSSIDQMRVEFVEDELDEVGLRLATADPAHVAALGEQVLDARTGRGRRRRCDRSAPSRSSRARHPPPRPRVPASRGRPRHRLPCFESYSRNVSG